MTQRVRVSDWFSFSHWGLFALPLFTCPDWYALGMIDLDDELFEQLDDEGQLGRCEVTNNPCGTDTWEINHPCQCSACQRYLARIWETVTEETGKR